MTLSSVDFADGASLPFECSYESRNLSPALSWSGAPLGTRSFAISCQDRDGPDARPWTHWLLWNIPATETRLRPGLPQYPRLEDGMEQGLNDYLEYGWCGPCPPVGVHEYSFAIYALDSLVSPVAPTPRVVMSAISARVLDVARLTASYGSDGSARSLSSLGREGRAAYLYSA